MPPQTKKAKTDNGGKSVLEQIKEFTVVVADTGDFSSIKK